MVAESTEILAPMLQFGCATACSGVISAISASDFWRNGPPDAVRMIFSTASELFCSRHWKIALCSESTGTMMALQRVTSRITTAPAQTSVSLLARPMTAPRLIAARVGSRPAAPTIADITHAAGRAAASITAARPAATSTPVPARADFTVWKCASLPIATKRGRNALACSISRAAFSWAVSASTE